MTLGQSIIIYCCYRIDSPIIDANECWNNYRIFGKIRNILFQTPKFDFIGFQAGYFE